MSTFARLRRPSIRRPLVVAAMAVSVLTLLLIKPQPAAAHGSAIDPPSRHYGCATRWVDWLNPVMKPRTRCAGRPTRMLVR